MGNGSAYTHQSPNSWARIQQPLMQEVNIKVLVLTRASLGPGRPYHMQMKFPNTHLLLFVKSWGYPYLLSPKKFEDLPNQEYAGIHKATPHEDHDGFSRILYLLCTLIWSPAPSPLPYKDFLLYRLSLLLLCHLQWKKKQETLIFLLYRALLHGSILPKHLSEEISYLAGFYAI